VYNEFYHATYPTPWFCWERYNLWATDDSSGHSLSFAANGRVLVVVHYKLSAADLVTPPNPDAATRKAYIERAIIARSIALY
jgi:hypothetical protein